MLFELWLLIQFVMLSLGLAFGSQLPQSPLEALLLVAMSALVIAPVVPWVARILARVLSLASEAPPARPRTRAVRRYRVVGDPGTPGTALARAPSAVVHAFA